ncbi:uncharacterized protein LOC134187084 isoform X2 [Corticium candelabrum]|uniref:uncharacterized protein LOC134187084 isoform X2 n=1 Tax=Corticium candelabrum TaxID=121492 RepID=UPI002E25B9C4|nr:uncharacterized protein LOC134187084 isoform X2 [Corticium candelabrum]
MTGRGSAIPKYRFYLDFPEQWDDVFSYMDNAVTQWCQRLNNTFLVVLDQLVTFGTSIEVGVVISFFFFYLGLDSLVIAASSVMMALVVVTQVPKRFLWRRRPHVAGRAKMLYDGTLTSSFPSRAVTCCVVYLYLLSGILEILSRPEKDPVAPFRLLWSPAFILFTIWAVVWTSIARIGVGVHYASDCIAGVVQAGIVCYIAETTYYIIVNACCQGAAPFHADRALLLHHINWPGLAIATITGVVAVFVLESDLVQYWSKAHFVLGLLYPVLCGLFLFCCGYHQLPRANMYNIDIHQFLLATAVPLLLLVVGRNCLPHSSGKTAAASFLLLHVTGMIVIMWHRLFHDSII